MVIKPFVRQHTSKDDKSERGVGLRRFIVNPSGSIKKFSSKPPLFDLVHT